MTVTEAMNGITPSADTAGFQMADDFILAFKTEDTQNKEGDYIVCESMVEEHSAAVNSSTVDKNYIRQGQVTIKTNTQRVFTINADRYHDEKTAFFDWISSFKMVHGVGSDVIADYVYFNMFTGKGEKGRATVNVTADATNGAGNVAGYTVTVSGINKPTEFTYSAAG